MLAQELTTDATRVKCIRTLYVGVIANFLRFILAKLRTKFNSFCGLRKPAPSQIKFHTHKTASILNTTI